MFDIRLLIAVQPTQTQSKIEIRKSKTRQSPVLRLL
jgi:hypothetical protein